MKMTLQVAKLDIAKSVERQENSINYLHEKGSVSGINLIDYELGRKDGLLEALMILRGDVAIYGNTYQDPEKVH